ncbi:MAG: hypothetical protein F4Y13_08175, partial [Acidimicrobiaceae bacterium]|nr:hypothetical protein [Acidimicrobiaceae bacterium]
LFNAAFFAGLDFIDYQSHSIYLSRYPYGREATVSYPAPDLIVENNTPYGVMLWPTTGDSSIAVRLYSTPWVLADQTNQWSEPRGTSCTRVVTERTRTWLEDGRSETDTVRALYRPEGLNCDGTPSVTTTTTTTTTIAPESTIPPEGSEYEGAGGGGSDQLEPAGSGDGSQSGETTGSDNSPSGETSSGDDTGSTPATTIPDE